jgi:hypothetical protein
VISSVEGPAGTATESSESFELEQLYFGGYGLVEVRQKGSEGQRVLAGGVGDGMERRDVAADALQPMLVKDDDGLRVALDDLLDQAIRGDRF